MHIDIFIESLDCHRRVKSTLWQKRVIQKYNQIYRKPNQTFGRLIECKGSIVKS